MTPADVPVAALQTFALVLSALFISYVVAIVLPYCRERPRLARRRHRGTLGPSSNPVHGDAGRFQWQILVPCRDEEAVIGPTIAYLRDTYPDAHVWVIDDASEDGSRRIIEEYAASDDAVHLVRRHLPAARTGKGDALNAAYAELDTWVRDHDMDRSRVIVGVIDADGRPEPACLSVCAADRLFGSPSIGAVQVGVRMLNRDHPRPVPHRGRLANAAGRLLVRLQDIDFQGPISAIQHSRRVVGTVALGGNGQFTRLSALDDLRRDGVGPWRGALLEDFEIGLHLLLAGWKNEFTEATWVDQEGLTSLRRFMAQRTRWGQGTMQCIKYLPNLWTSHHFSHLGALEVVYYLVQPWLNLLGSVIFALPTVVLVGGGVRDPSGTWDFIVHGGGWSLVLVYLIGGIGIFAMWGPLYRQRCEPDAGRIRAVGWGVAYWLYSNTVYVADWRALVRIVRGNTGWAKTRRNAEIGVLGPVAKDR